MSDRTIEINVPVLARVEGEGALDLSIEGDQITELKLRIYEPPRYFEKFLEGRSYQEVPDIVARICGICPVAYQMSAVHAIESIFGIQVSSWIRDMRRLIYCGEWLQSHSLHIHMLAAPDFLGFKSVIEMAQTYPDEVRRGLELQSLGNDLISLLGARSVNPVGVCVGGFYKAPDIAQIESIRLRLQQAVEQATALLAWVASLEIPHDIQSVNMVSMRHHSEYPLNEGRIVSSTGLDIDIEEFDSHFRETHEPHSTALHCLLNDQPYLVGPLARLNNNLDRLPAHIAHDLESTGLVFPSGNMFHSMIARAVEIQYAVHEALRLTEDYSIPEKSRETIKPVAGVGYGCTEAPRGLLWHRYQVDDKGIVQSARIVPPTSQNQARIEQDLRASLQSFGLDNAEDEIRHRAETVIRNYDPCISCATHFLKMSVTRQFQQGASLPDSQRIAKSIVLIGIGSPRSDDQHGWEVVNLLSNSTLKTATAGVEFINLDRPGLNLRNYLQGVDAAVLVDSLQGFDGENKVVCLSARDMAAETGPLSSHSIGLEETLSLLSQLDELPEITLVFGISCRRESSEEERMATFNKAASLIRKRVKGFTQ